jgi:hypothetical protein
MQVHDHREPSGVRDEQEGNVTDKSWELLRDWNVNRANITAKALANGTEDVDEGE